MVKNKMRESKYYSGDYLRVQQYPVRRTPYKKRGRRFAPTSEVQAKLNAKNSEYRFNEILQANFGKGSLVVGLDYADYNMPETVDTAERLLKNFFRAINYRLKKQGKPNVKYVYVTAHGTLSGRIHHHLVMDCDLPKQELISLWGYGRIQIDPVDFDTCGLLGLSKYLNRQSESSRRWNSSKGLIRPEPVKSDNNVTLSNARYIAQNPDDYAYIEKLYPGYGVYKVIPAAEGEDGQLPGIFNTLLLYRKDAEWLDRYKRKRKTREGGSDEKL